MLIMICRQHLKHALGLASRAQDNHLRALVLALIAAHYVHTAPGQAGEMLGTCEQLAAGLGAGAGTGADAVGNAPLRLWVGERFLGAWFAQWGSRLGADGFRLQSCTGGRATSSGRRRRRG